MWRGGRVRGGGGDGGSGVGGDEHENRNEGRQKKTRGWFTSLRGGVWGEEDYHESQTERERNL